MALKLGTGTEAYAPLARAIIGGLLVSVTLTVFIVPSAVLIIYRRKQTRSHASCRSGAGVNRSFKRDDRKIIFCPIASILLRIRKGVQQAFPGT